MRRLMYQTLIRAAVLSDEPGGLGAAFDTKGLQRVADTLVDGMRRNVEFDRNFLRREVLVDEPQAIELTGGQASDALGHLLVLPDVLDPVRAVHGVIPELSNAIPGTRTPAARILPSLR